MEQLYRMAASGNFEEVRSSWAGDAVADLANAAALGTIAETFRRAFDTSTEEDRQQLAGSVLAWVARNPSSLGNAFVPVVVELIRSHPEYMEQAIREHAVEIKQALAKLLGSALRDEWHGREMLRDALAAAAERELGALAREQANAALAAGEEP